MIIIQIVSTIALFLQVLILWITIYQDHNRRKMQSTLEYIKEIRIELHGQDDIINKKLDDNAISLETARDADAYSDIIKVLMLYEYLAVGVKQKIYDIDTVYLALGTYISMIDSKYALFISQLRDDKSEQTLYNEIKYLANLMQKKRDPTKQPRRKLMSLFLILFSP